MAIVYSNIAHIIKALQTVYISGQLCLTKGKTAVGHGKAANAVIGFPGRKL
jgi:hypothetical protein